MSLYLI